MISFAGLITAGAMAWMTSVKADISAIRDTMIGNDRSYLETTGGLDKRLSVLESQYATIIKALEKIDTKLE